MATLNSSNKAASQPETPWYSAYPPARTTPASLSGSEVLQWLQDGRKPGKDFVLVDLGRNDYEVTSCELF
jgi:arsenical-resistance protein 2